MPRSSRNAKADSFNFRIDPALKSAFTQAAEAADKPAAQVLREFMRAYVRHHGRKAFEQEARRQSREAASRATDPASDETRSLLELESLFDENSFHDEWKA